MSGENQRQGEEPKFRVDEEWQKEAERERERLRQAEAGDTGGAEQQAQEQKAAHVPAPDLQSFLAGLYTQTLVALGILENPATREREQNLDEGQYLIDVIAMLEEKMRGNLSTQEENAFKNILYQLRMEFVRAKTQPPSADEQA